MKKNFVRSALFITLIMLSAAFTNRVSGETQTHNPIFGNTLYQVFENFALQAVIFTETIGTGTPNATGDAVVAAIPDIQVVGNGNQPINNGDTTPSTLKDTDFGSTTEPNTVTRSFGIQNAGGETLNISGVTITCPEAPAACSFTVTRQPPATIAPNTTAILEVTFAPNSPGIKNATVNIFSNDPDENPYTFAISGSRAPADIQVVGNGNQPINNGDTTPSTLKDTDFGSTTAPNTVTRSFGIQNAGGETLNISGVTITCPEAPAACSFTVTRQPPATIAPNTTAILEVTFAPNSPGIKNATVNIFSNDPDENPYTFAIRGNSVAPTITSASNTTFTVGRLGSFQVTATGDPAPTFSTTGPLPAGITLSSSGLLSGTPTANGVFNFTITASNGASPDATQSFTLTVNLAPTAATVSVSGRVTTISGRGIMNVRLSLTDSNGEVRTATTTSFGYYRFDDVQAGETYTLAASGKHYTFSQSIQVLNINEETNEVNFVANSEKRLRIF
jgi:hypothetical protein